MPAPLYRVRSLTARVIVLVGVAACGDPQSPSTEAAATPPLHSRGAACVRPAEGCPCGAPDEVISCFEDPQRLPGGELLCGEGARVCRDGYWSGCEDVQTYVRGGSRDALGAALIDANRDEDGGVPNCTDCDVLCFRAVDDLDPADGPLDGSNASGGATYSAPTGLTLVGDPGVATPPMDANVPPAYGNHTAIFEGLLPGEQVTLLIDYLTFRVAKLDVYFLVELDATMAEELSALDAALGAASGVDLKPGTCVDADFDGMPDVHGDGILEAIRCAVADPWFGVGYYREIPFAPFAPAAEVAYAHLQDMAADPAPTEAAVAMLAVNNLASFADPPSAQTVALHTLAAQLGEQALAVPPRADCPAGTAGYPCFRPDALRLVINLTDRPAHNGPSGHDYALSFSVYGAPDAQVDLSGVPGNATFPDPLRLGDPTGQWLEFNGTTSGLPSVDERVVCCNAHAGAADAVHHFTIAGLADGDTQPVTLTTRGSSFDTVVSLHDGIAVAEEPLPILGPSGTVPQAQPNPVRDISSGEIYVTGSAQASGSDFQAGLGAHNGLDPMACRAAPGGNDVVLQFELSQDATVRANSFGSGFGGALSVFTTPPSPRPKLADAGYQQLGLVDNDTPADAYVVSTAVDGQYLTLNANNAANAASLPGAVVGCGAADYATDAVYQFRLDSPTRVRIDTEGSEVGTVLSLHRGTATAALGGLALPPLEAEAPLANCRFETYLDKAYYFCDLPEHQTTTFAQAEALCQAAGGDLAHIRSSAEDGFLRARLSGLSFIGAAETSEGDFVWTDDGSTFWSGGAGGTAVQYAGWSSCNPTTADCSTPQPDNQRFGSGSADCVVLCPAGSCSGGGWADETCSASRGFLCEFVRGETVSPPPFAGFDGHYSARGSSAYFFSDEALGQPAAAEACAQRGWVLAEVDDAAENAHLRSHAGVAQWIGADDAATEGSFRWQDGDALAFSDFAPAPQGRHAPDSRCFHVDNAGSSYWVCENARSFEEAERHCVAQGGHLAHVDDAAEQAFLLSQAVVDDRTWLGGTDDPALALGASEGNWVWVDDDSPVSFPGWQAGHPYTASSPSWGCLAMVADPYDSWWTTHCDEPHSYICEHSAAATTIGRGGDDDGDTREARRSLVAGRNHGCRVEAGGGVRCWGDNQWGQLGTGDNADARGPRRVGGLAQVVSLSAGRDHSCAVTSDGSLACWGRNERGQSRDYGFSSVDAPHLDAEANDRRMAGVAAGGAHTCGLDYRGGVRCWGDNSYGQAGTTASGSIVTSPVDVAVPGRTVELGAGADHSCALVQDGRVYCWGRNQLGQLGNAPPGLQSDVAVEVPLADRAWQLVAGGNHSCALLRDGHVQCWGDNTFGATGDLATAPVGAPMGVGAVQALAAGWSDHSCALLADGTARCWGLSEHGQLGDGVAHGVGAVNATPVAVLGLTDAEAVAAGAHFSCFARRGGEVLCSGSNADPDGVAVSAHRLADGSGAAFDAPIQAPVGPAGAVEIAAGNAHSCALLADGRVVCWGDPDSGRLGDGQAWGTAPRVPVEVVGLDTAVALAVHAPSRDGLAGGHSCAVLSSGEVYCWGIGREGQLGDGNATDSDVPVHVAGLAGATDVVAGQFHSCAIHQGGLVSCWGFNSAGQLGDGTTTERHLPVPVTLEEPALALAAGREHTCALLANTTMACWGRNHLGQLGNGSSVNSFSPVAVRDAGGSASLSSLSTIAAGDHSTCAVSSAGTAWCWGHDDDEQLGQSSGAQDRALPVPLYDASWPNYVDDALAIDIGPHHGCLLRTGGAMACWGDGDRGRLGTGSSGDSWYPQAVVGGGALAGLAVGADHTCALRADGEVVCFGSGDAGRLADGFQSDQNRADGDGVVGNALGDAGRVDCVAQSLSDGHWRDYDCASARPFVCEGPVADLGPTPERVGPRLPPVGDPVGHAGRAYTFSQSVGDFDSARATCAEAGWQLVHIDDAAEDAFLDANRGLLNLSGATPYEGYWIGASDADEEGAWRWLDDGSQFWTGGTSGATWGSRYENWTACSVTQPEQGSAANAGLWWTSPGCGWSDSSASATAPFVCESPADFWPSLVHVGEHGDDVGAAVAVRDFTAEPVVLEGDTRVLSADYDEGLRGCGAGGGPGAGADMVFRFSLAADADVTLSAEGTTFPHALSLYEASAFLAAVIAPPVPDAELACAADSTPISQMLAAGDYVVVLAGQDAGDAGAFQLSLSAATAMAAPAQRIACGDSGTGPGGSTFIEQDLAAGDYTVVVKGTQLADHGKYSVTLRDVETHRNSVACGSPGDDFEVDLPAGGPYYAILKGNVPPGSPGGARQLAAGEYHGCLITDAGGLRCWGDSDWGQLGLGYSNLYPDYMAPVDVPGLSNLRSVDAGGLTTCAVRQDGILFCWGHNDNGQVGDGTFTERTTPVQVTAFSPVSTGASGDGPFGRLSVGAYHSCALLEDGRVACWGYNANGRLGDGSTGHRNTPVIATGLADARDLGAGGHHTCAATDDGQVFCWGYNASGQLGDGSTSEQRRPRSIGGIGGAVPTPADVREGRRSRVAIADNHGCAVGADRGVYCWGYGGWGRLGDGSDDTRYLPGPVYGIDDALEVAVGAEYACVLRDTNGDGSGEVHCWGYNGRGELGDGTTASRFHPAPVADLTDAVQIGSYDHHTCAARMTGEVMCWGHNPQGQLGDGSTAQRVRPVLVSGLTQAVQVAVGSDHSCALSDTDADGNGDRVDCWGDDGQGQLGDGGGNSDSHTPVAVVGLVAPQQIGAGHEHACAVEADGSLRCWGRGNEGQLGRGSSADADAAVDVTGISDALHVDAGHYHTCVARSGGATTCWGLGNDGRLGTGRTTSSSLPAPAAGLPAAVPVPVDQAGLRGTRIAAGGDFSCAVADTNADGTGEVSCWGESGEGRLGDGGGGGGDRHAPGAVTGLTDAVQVSAGLRSACAVIDTVGDGSGEVHCWGSGDDGRLGSGGSTDQATPAAILSGSDYLQVATHDRHACAVRTDGGIDCWGEGDDGELGDGMGSDSDTPVGVSGIADAIQVAVGARHSCALRATGAVLCWGAEADGRLGNGANGGGEQHTPQPVLDGGASPLTGAVQISVGANHSCALLGDASVVCWGRGDDGRLGNGATADEDEAAAVVGLADVLHVDAGGDFTCAVVDSDTDGDGDHAVCWGEGWDGRLGNGGTSQQLSPVSVLYMGDVAQVSAGSQHACAIDQAGRAYCWGEGADGRLGDGTTAERRTPVEVTGRLSAGVQVAAGHHHSCALDASGDVYCWGYNGNGRLGVGDTDARRTPSPVPRRIEGVTQVEAGEWHSCGLSDPDADGLGTLYCWGQGGSGQLGHGGGGDSRAPQQVGLLTDVRDVATGDDHSCAIAAPARTLYCWGAGGSGRLGDGATTSRPLPTQVSGLPATVVSVGAGDQHTCAVLGDGSVHCWGQGSLGRLGNGGSGSSNTPVQVSGIGNAIQVDVDDNVSCAQLADGGVRCWGYGANGRLGDGDDQIRDTPVTTLTPPGVVKVSVGHDHACAITAAGDVSCWGYNGVGRLGDGTYLSSAVPVPLNADVVVRGVSVGHRHTCSTTVDGGVLCWGRNAYGQLGDGSTVRSNAPTRVIGIDDAVDVASGTEHSCALRAGGRVSCWGLNNYWQLGQGWSSLYSLAPIDVPGITGATQVVSGHHYSCALMGDGSVRCWGKSYVNPALGATPQPVAGLAGIVRIDAEWDHFCGVTADGRARCAGEGDDGQLGDGLSQDSFWAAQPVAGVDDAQQVAVGYGFSCALGSQGQLGCWGENGRGQLASGSYDDSDTPASDGPVSAGARSVATGEHVCVIGPGGGVQCWGDGGSGALGNGDNQDSTVPVDVLDIDNAIDIAAHEDHSCALRDDDADGQGEVYCWGDNDEGEIGDGTLASTSTPSAVGGLRTPIAAGAADRTVVSVGTHHSCALSADGHIACWGRGADGRLGNGRNDNRAVATRVIGDDFVQVDTTDDGLSVLACGVHASGQLECWGRDYYGQLGDGGGATGYSNRPVNALLNRVAQVSTGEGYACAVTESGELYCWGRGGNHRLGLGSTANRDAPTRVGGIAGVSMVSTGVAHGCAIADGATRQVYCWGEGADYRLGTGTTTNQPTPVAVPGMSGALQVVAANRHSCAVLTDGTLHCWGRDDYGVLGNGAGGNLSVPTPIPVPGGGDVSYYDSRATHACAVRSTGALYCWGRNNQGQLGVGDTTDRTAPAQVLASGVVQVAAGVDHTCVAMDDGGVRCFGDNGDLEGGLAVATDYEHTPRPVVALVDDAVGIATGRRHGCARTAGHRIHCWGDNGDGQLGTGATSPGRMLGPVEVQGLPSPRQVRDVDLGFAHSCALLAVDVAGSWQDQVWCWGENNEGQVGDGSFAGPRPTPARVSLPGLGAIAGITSQQDHTCAFGGDTVMCWGRGDYGQLGVGTTTDAATAATVQFAAGLVPAGATIATVDAGDQHTCALLDTGAAYCWGDNDYGQLGDGTTTRRTLPAPVPALSDAVEVALGREFSCAIRATGEVDCWGRNDEGQLGLGFSEVGAGHRGPIDNGTGLTTGRLVGLGHSHGCAIADDAAAGLFEGRSGGVYCWGENAFGQLGDGSSADAWVPAPVTLSGLLSSGEYAVDVDGGRMHSCALASDGSVMCWGWDADGQVGDGGSAESSRLTPRTVLDVSADALLSQGDPALVRTGYQHSCAVVDPSAGVDRDVLYCWGQNSQGQVGVAGGDLVAPMATGLTDVVALGLGEHHSCAIRREAGHVIYCWGDNDQGQLGRTGGDSAAETAVVDSGAVLTGDEVAVVGGVGHSCALSAGGRVACWGDNGLGQLGVPGADSVAPVGIPAARLSGAIAIDAGEHHGCALLDTGEVRCWGLNDYGQLGDGTDYNSDTPVAVAGIVDAVDVSCGARHTCVVRAGGEVHCFGRGNNGRLGNGNDESQRGASLAGLGAATGATDWDYVVSIGDHSVVRGDHRLSCNDDVDALSTHSEIAAYALPNGEYYAVVKGREAAAAGAYRLTVGTPVVQNYDPPTYAQAISRLNAEEIRVASVTSCDGGDAHCPDARNDADSFATDSFAQYDPGGGDQPVALTAQADGSDYAQQVVASALALPRAGRMDVSIRVVDQADDPALDPNPFTTTITPLDAGLCQGVMGNRYLGCLPGAVPTFEVTFQNPPMPGEVADNGSDPYGGYGFLLRMVATTPGVGTQEVLVDEIPVYLVPNATFAPSVPMDGAYSQTLQARACDRDDRPDWSELNLIAHLPLGTEIDVSACTADSEAELAGCTMARVASLRAVSDCAGGCPMGTRCAAALPNITPDDVCVAVESSVTCMIDDDCPLGISCDLGVCVHGNGAPDIATTLPSGFNGKPWSRYDIDLRADGGRVLAPTLDYWDVTYECTILD